MELIDLHTHTTASDGIYSPAALIDLAIEKGVRAMAVTDHDTVGGLAEALAHAEAKNFRLIPGIEFSIDFRGGSFHLVGMGVDHRNGDLLEVTEGLRKRRSTRISRIVEDLANHGIAVSEDEIIGEAGGESLGRPHVARVLIRHGYGRDMEDVFTRFLVPGKPGYVKKEKIQLPEAVRLIRGAGGIAIIAHPVSLNFEKFSRFVPMLEEFIRQGIEGLEVYAAMHDESHVDQFRTLAGKYNLVISGGSDFHGDKREKLGYYSPIRPIPAEILAPLQERIGITA
jgi:hypothetical protein